MEKSKFLYGALGFLVLGLASCSDDTPVLENPKAEYDQQQYIAVQISSPRDNFSRVFEDGTINESAVKRLDFFFYDVNGNPTSTPLTLQEDETGTIPGGTFSDDLPPVNEGTDDNPVYVKNVTRIFTSVVTVALTQGQNLPSQVICIVNGVEANINQLKNKTLEQLIDVERDSYRNGNTFLMSNSVYYGQNVLTGQANQRLCATPINTTSQLFGTKAAAQKAIEDAATKPNAIVDIYVERLAAKVGLTMSADAVKPYVLQNGEGAGTISLTFTPEYWAMNATDETVYLTKRYGVETTTGTGADAVTSINQTPSYLQINNALTAGGFTAWNDPTHYRSYWGSSPSYFANNYPDVSDDVNDLEGNITDYATNYYSYNEVKNQATRTDAGEGGIGKQALAAAAGGSFSIINTGATASGFIYTRETTVAKQRINNVATGNPAAAVAAAVVVGKYKITGATGDATTFYIDRNSGENGTYYASEENAKNTLIRRQAIVFANNNGTGPINTPATYVLKHPSKAVRELATTKLAGRLVTIQLASVPSPAVYYYNINKDNGEGKEKGGYEPITEENLTDVNAQLLSVGYMDKFENGMAFYSVPIRHLNWKDETCLVKVVNNNVTTYGPGYNWEGMPSGALGVVRNHVYNLTISQISGLGTALRDANQPIVPAKEEANQYIAARLNILAWNIANTWTVEL